MSREMLASGKYPYYALFWSRHASRRASVAPRRSSSIERLLFLPREVASNVSFAVGLFVVGLIALIVGSELVLRSGTLLAALLGVKPIVIGLTIVALGTSTPELAVGIAASAQGSGMLAVGNIAGTNMFNILFILGLSAALEPLQLQLHSLKLHLPVMVLSSAALFMLALDGVLTRVEGGVMVLAAIGYTGVVVWLARREPAEVKAEFAGEYQLDTATRSARRGRSLGRSLLVLAAGLAVVVVGAQTMVDGAVAVARLLHVSDAVIGLTIVAVGTSAPELVSTVLSTLKGERDIAVGNLIGSSTYNILVILGVTCAVTPGGVRIDEPLLYVDLALTVAVALLCIPVFTSDSKVSRAEGVFFVSLYVAYLSVLLWLHV